MTATPFLPVPWTSPQGVWSVLVDPPTEEPLTLAEAKLAAGLDWLDGDPRDALLQDFIREARAQVEHDTGLALLTQTRDVYFGDTVGAVVPLPSQTQPVQSIAPIAATTTTTTGYPCPWRYAPGRLTSVYPPVAGAGFRVVAGWPSAAALRLEAPSLHHAVVLLTAHYATTGRDLVGETVGQRAQTPLGYEDAIAPHRLIWVI